ncbi:MAG TPA: hypothetical protein VNN25_23470, partial [Thermoanaerobaculia bacterium]|nr:hypothetical protein [Thermoanaerobaculia bacterium]
MIGTVDAHTIGVVVNDGGPIVMCSGSGRRHRSKLFVSSQSASIEFRGDELVVMAADEARF